MDDYVIHFTSIFRLNGSYFLIDDTKKMAYKKIPENSGIKLFFGESFI
jgi:hypothetical protein